MGVTGLWTVVHPCARPVKIETLNKKRLAVDASIWIYQFLKAVRDKEGNALRNSHVVGFFRRICKLLFFGIKPVFVFDGGAPTLKRQTINNRKRRREGRRDDAVKTAGKLLALQMQRLAEEEEQKRKDESKTGRAKHTDVEEEPIPENLVYAEEAHMTTQERQQNRKFKKTDAYHLPELDRSMAEMGQPDDPRIMSVEELRMYAEQFSSGEDINVYDFSKIDFDSPFFTSLPASDRYNILNAARLRSRLRMGHSKEQLDAMFPDRMAFSRFQIERVAERNNLTQRLMHINSLDGDLDYGGVSRVAGEKGREYVLVKNDGVEGGWALGVVTNKDEGKIHKPIDLDKPVEEAEAEVSSDDEFEDVPIVGINRLPKAPAVDPATADILARNQERRRALYRSRRANGTRIPKTAISKDPESLFVADESETEEWEDVAEFAAQENLNVPNAIGDDDKDLQKAIAMSLQPDILSEAEEEDDFQEVFQQSRAEEARPFIKGSGMSIAHMANSRSNKVVPKSISAENSDDDEMDLQAALLESRRTRHKPKSPVQTSKTGSTHRPASASSSIPAKAPGFDGPLPFEKLDLGSSLLGKKKMEKLADDAAGGFEREPQEPQKKSAAPMPTWFSTTLEESLSAQREREEAEREREERERLEREALNEEFIFDEPLQLRKRDPPEVIDVDAPEHQTQRSIIQIDSSDEEKDSDNEMQGVTMNDSAELIQRLRTPSISPPENASSRTANPELPRPLVEESAQQSRANFRPAEDSPMAASKNVIRGSESIQDHETTAVLSDDEPLVWSESDSEEIAKDKHPQAVETDPVGGSMQMTLNDEMADASEEDEFEDVVVPAPQLIVPESTPPFLPVPPTAGTRGENIPEALTLLDRDLEVPPLDGPLVSAELQQEEEAYQDQYSDPEDEELFRQLAQEQEEHARFASTLNNRSLDQNIADYEKELKQLRNQQAKDRRDADEVTQTMVSECQQLLALFGLPYITAPMEAEAQCAELVHLGLVDGIVTDDSDIFLFGGTRVYKNMFNSAKFVECYLTSDLESEFGLTRQRLISIAQLLGSDYTEGLPGVGPVTALEILSEFDNLTDFKEWLNAVQLGQRSKQDDAASAFKKKFRKNATKVFVPSTFPDLRVEEAYHHPEVDSDPSAFVWGVPDLSALRSFLMATIGWTSDRTDEVLVPVIKDMNRRQNEGTQANITAFFDGGVGAGAFAPRRRAEGGSKRLETALHKIGQRARGNISAASDDTQAGEDEPQNAAATRSKPKGRKRITKSSASRTKPADLTHDHGEEGDFYEAAPKKKVRKVMKNTKGKGEKASNEDETELI
ncbi:hypothetical protein FKW77_010278 [Venturia effusa]|uniref:PIN domain-like protein n=1 Tax=Venturia effusa TaxID=50376 RepID=A0A517L0E3_9PEZI|nr:hypothetical protein FKW77_010278 [Venturia effusa]